MDVKYIIGKLEAAEVPSGFERDLVIIGSDFYFVAKKERNVFLGRDQPTLQLKKAVFKREGVFFSKDHRARMLIEKNNVLATELLRRTGAKKRKPSPTDYGSGGDDHFPYPYIFNPPRPPGDLSRAAQVHVHIPLKGNFPEDDIYCQFCGMELASEEQFTHSCKSKPK